MRSGGWRATAGAASRWDHMTSIQHEGQNTQEREREREGEEHSLDAHVGFMRSLVG